MVRSKTSRRGWVWLGHLAVGGLCFFLGVIILRSVVPASPEVLLPGTALTVRVTRPLTSRDTRLGDTFEARVDSAQGIDGRSPVPARARVEGRCVAVRAGESDGRPGYLRLVLSGLWDGQGHFSPLETTTASLSGKGAVESGQKPPEILSSSSRPARTQDSAATADHSSEVVVTPDAALTFILLKPAVIGASR